MGAILDEAQRVLKKIQGQKGHKYFIPSLYYLGMTFFIKRKWDPSIEYFKEYLRFEKKRHKIVKTLFLMANAYETKEALKEAYDIYYSLLGDYPNPEVVKNRLKSLYERRVARKR